MGCSCSIVDSSGGCSCSCSVSGGDNYNKNYNNIHTHYYHNYHHHYHHYYHYNFLKRRLMDDMKVAEYDIFLQLLSLITDNPVQRQILQVGVSVGVSGGG